VLLEVLERRNTMSLTNPQYSKATSIKELIQGLKLEAKALEDDDFESTRGQYRNIAIARYLIDVANKLKELDED